MAIHPVPESSFCYGSGIFITCSHYHNSDRLLTAHPVSEEQL
jgi:hypothetical protein